jgi:hypothetical protein
VIIDKTEIGILLESLRTELSILRHNNPQDVKRKMKIDMLIMRFEKELGVMELCYK